MPPLSAANVATNCSNTWPVGSPLLHPQWVPTTDIVVPGNNGFLANTTAEWAIALYQLIDDEHLRADLGANGRRMVEERFALEPAAHALLRLFRSLNSQEMLLPT